MVCAQAFDGRPLLSLVRASGLRVNQQLAWFSQTLEAVDAPWPARIDALVDSQVGLFNQDVPFDRSLMIQRTTAIVAPLAMMRTMRAAVGMRFRRQK